MAGNVAVRFSVEDQEVVRKALEDLGEQGKAALKKMDDAAKAPSAGMKAISTVVEELKAKLIGLAVPLGPAGSALIALGPAGLAAAAGIGAAITVIHKLGELADELATKSNKLANFAELTGLSTDQVQALGDATMKAGKSQEDTNAVIERAVQAWDLLRRGQGDAYDQIRKIDPELLNQLANAHDVASALDLLAKAYANAGDEASKIALARAFGGKGGTSTMAALLGGIDEAGGLRNLTSDAKEAGSVIDKDLIQRLSTLQSQIKDIQERTKDKFASLYSEQELEYDRQGAENLERIVNALKALKESSPPAWMSDQALFDRLRGFLANVNSGLSGAAEPTPPRRITVTGGEREPPPPLPQSRPADAPQPPPNLAVDLRSMRDQIGLLGSATTATEQYRLKELELKKAVDDKVISDGQAARALGAFKLAQDQVIEGTRERLGIATQDNIVSVRMAQLRDAQAKGIIQSDAEFAAAEQLVQREARQTAEALEVRNSAFKGLKQMEIDGRDLSKSLDSGLTASLNGVENGLVDITTGSVNASDGIANLEKSAVRSLEQMAVKMTVTASLAKVLSAALNAFGLGNSGSITLGNSTGPTPFPSADGNVFSRGNVQPFALGGIVRQPTLFPMANGGTGLAGERDEEGILPLTRINGKLGVYSAGGSGSKVTVNLNNAPAGTTAQSATATPDGNGGLSIDVMFANSVRGVIGGDLSNGTGIAPQLKKFAQASGFKGG